MINLTSPIPSVYHISVSADFAGQRIDNFLINHLKGVPRTRIYRILRKGEVRVNKGRAKPDYRLQEADSIRIPPVRMEVKPEKTLASMPSKFNKQLLSEILYEDDGLMVINKPAGIAVHGGSGISFGVIESIRLLRPELRSLELVHRLDRDTSGCLMIAKRRSMLKWLHELLRTGQLGKTYLALVKGQWDGGPVNAPLQKNVLSSGERMVRVNQEGQAAITEFTARTHYEGATLVEARPLTGRTHQIRVHATHAGHPIAGDPKYNDPVFNREMKAKGLDRLFLHAQALNIPLPNQSDTLTVEAPLGLKLTQFLEKLGGSSNV